VCMCVSNVSNLYKNSNTDGLGGHIPI